MLHSLLIFNVVWFWLTIRKKDRKGKMESTTKVFERPFEELLEESVRIHGHLCAGQVLGVRLAILGLRLIGICDPKGQDRKSFMVYVEIDRCATDAIQSVTGCSLGKRSLRWVDYGIMAATFVNLKTGKAFRIVAREESRELSRKYCPEIKDKYRRQLKAYKLMSDNELFRVQEVGLEVPVFDLPGRPVNRVQCEACGDYVQDCREVKTKDGRVLCRACAHGAYYKIL
jgi:formylmethanofuran dehydrogenase subunit E